jgi:hypothetical protein
LEWYIEKAFAFWNNQLHCLEIAVVQLAEALSYKAEGRGFDSSWCHWNISFT